MNHGEEGGRFCRGAPDGERERAQLNDGSHDARRKIFTLRGDVSRRVCRRRVPIVLHFFGENI